LGAGLTIQPCKKVIVTKPETGKARARIGLYSHMMMILFSNTNPCSSLSVRPSLMPIQNKRQNFGLVYFNFTFVENRWEDKESEPNGNKDSPNLVCS
jgi:hypothetical protein